MNKVLQCSPWKDWNSHLCFCQHRDAWSIHRILMLIFKSLLITSTENSVSNNESPQCWLSEAPKDFKSLSTLFHSNLLCCIVQHCSLKTAPWLMEQPMHHCACISCFHVIYSKHFVPGLLGKLTFSILYFILYSVIQ